MALGKDGELTPRSSEPRRNGRAAVGRRAVAGGTIINAAVAYTTSLATYIVFRGAGVSLSNWTDRRSHRHQGLAVTACPRSRVRRRRYGSSPAVARRPLVTRLFQYARTTAACIDEISAGRLGGYDSRTCPPPNTVVANGASSGLSNRSCATACVSQLRKN
jgi:hypothetical protein